MCGLAMTTSSEGVAELEAKAIRTTHRSRHKSRRRKRIAARIAIILGLAVGLVAIFDFAYNAYERASGLATMGRCVKESAIPVQRHEDKWGIGSGYQTINCRMINDSRHVTRASADERVIQLERASGTAQRSTALEVLRVFGVAVSLVLRVPRIRAQRPAASRKRLAGCNH